MALLDIKNLSISFGGIKAVQNLSFQVHENEILGLIGPNGSGKSTCVNLISGTYKSDAGQIIFDGIELTNRHSIEDRVHLGLGRTFQTPKPFGSMTVYENVFTAALQKYGKKTAEEESLRVLEQTRLIEYRNMLSAKLPIEKRKWLDLARILVNKPKFIMLDEVMAGLNPMEIQSSVELIQQVNKDGVTFLFIEHVMKAVMQICHRVVVINQGQFLAEGKPEQVFQMDSVVEAYIGGAHNVGD